MSQNHDTEFKNRKCIDTFLGLGLGLWLGFPYVRMGGVCTYPHSFQAATGIPLCPRWLDNI